MFDYYNIWYLFQTLSPNSSVFTNSSSVKANNFALSICIFCLFSTSINFIYFLNAYISSFLYLSNFLLSSTSFSMSFREFWFLPYSLILASLSYCLSFSFSSMTRLSFASLLDPSAFDFLFWRSTMSISLFYSFICES